MNKTNNFIALKEMLQSFIVMDYCVELYSYNKENDSFVLSFYHLNSFYNGLAYINSFGETVVDFQYANENKTVERKIKRTAQIVSELRHKRISYETIAEYFDHYKKLCDVVFEAKYGIEEKQYDFREGSK